MIEAFCPNCVNFMYHSVWGLSGVCTPTVVVLLPVCPPCLSPWCLPHICFPNSFCTSDLSIVLKQIATGQGVIAGKFCKCILYNFFFLKRNKLENPSRYFPFCLYSSEAEAVYPECRGFSSVLPLSLCMLDLHVFSFSYHHSLL